MPTSKILLGIAKSRKSKMQIFRKLIFLLFFIFANFNGALAQPTIGQIEKTQQDLEKEQTLRREVEKGRKVYIKKIIVKGVTFLSEDEIKKIIQPFKNHWLTQSEINLILDSLVNAYQKKGYPGKLPRISFQEKERHRLEIKVEEIRP